MISIVMGKTGAGKTSYLAYLANKNIKKGRKVFSNVRILGTYNLPVEDLGKYDIRDSLIIIDEAGLTFNSREWKKMSMNFYEFITMHRHYNLDVVFSVQFWDRLDIVIRELVQEIIVVKPTILSSLGFVRINSVNVSIDIPEKTGQLQEIHSWKMFSLRYYYVRDIRQKMFNSFENTVLPKKVFALWS